MKLVSRAIGFLKESKNELAKVIWPSRKEVLKNTTVVILTILISMAVVFAFDFLLIKLVQIFVIR